jgi:hypothetical protein
MPAERQDADKKLDRRRIIHPAPDAQGLDIYSQKKKRGLA